MNLNAPVNKPNPIRRVVGYGSLLFAVILLVAASFLLFQQRDSLFTHGVNQPTPLPPITCKTPPHKAGTTKQTITSSGVQREYILHLPPSYGRQPQALMLMFHGYDMSAQDMLQMTGMTNLANKAGFIVVYPQGLDQPISWNAGNSALGATGIGNDVQFTSDLLQSLNKEYCIDSQRIYASGFSLGSGMAFRVACELGDKIAALATVSSAIYPLPEGCPSTIYMPVLEIHGSVDRLAPYEGKPSVNMQAIPDYLAGWVARNKCATTASTFLRKGQTVATQWKGCTHDVVVQHYVVANGNHTWYHSPNSPFDIDASTVVWDFCRAYTLSS